MTDRPLPGSCDVVVAGGGPAGSTTAALLAAEGVSVLLLERETFPRFHIGESLMPQTYWTLARLGMLDRLRDSGSPVKASVQFVSESGRASKPFYFFKRNPHECSYTWQVERAWFDRAMLENAAARGADVRTGVAVREVLIEESAGDPAAGRAAGVIAETADGATARVDCRVVVDATGQSCLLSRRLGLRAKDPRLVKASIYAHYENGRRDPGIDAGATIILHTPGNRGWFWYIPLSENRVSVGVVSAPGELFAARRPAGEILDEQIGACPAVAERLAAARRITPAHVISDFSYRASRLAGDGWVLVGDAFGFLDPVYSSGVFLALRSGEMAADAIAAALRDGEVSAARLGAFGPELSRGIEAIRKLVYAFYSPGFSFANFIREHPEHRDRLTDILIGDVFKDGVMDIFDDMKSVCDLPDDVPLEAG